MKLALTRLRATGRQSLQAYSSFLFRLFENHAFQCLIIAFLAPNMPSLHYQRNYKLSVDLIWQL